MQAYAVVFLGAGLGGALRHGVNLLAARFFGAAFYGTFIVNIVGCLALGMLAGYFTFKGDASQAWRQFLTTGVLGGFTTFSAFSMETVLLWERGEVAVAALYVLGSVVLSLAGFSLGLYAYRHGLS